jgi:hypothetical protein
MRTSPVVISLLFAACSAQISLSASSFLDVSGVESLAINNANIAWDQSLFCGACTRGGYQFCKYSDAAKLPTCREKEPVVFVQDEYICSGYWVDQFNSVNNFCYPAKDTKRPVACSDYDVPAIAKNDAVSSATINGLAVGDTCVFRAKTVCGFVQANLTYLFDINKQDYDIAFGYSSMAADEFIDPAKNDTLFVETDNSDSLSGDSDKASGYLRINKPVNQTAFDKCDGGNQNMFIMVTRIKKTDIPPQSQVPMTGRVLAPEDKDIVIKFSSWAGKEKSAMRLFAAASFALAAMLSVFAF